MVRDDWGGFVKLSGAMLKSVAELPSSIYEGVGPTCRRKLQIAERTPYSFGVKAMRSVAERRALFHRLHESGCFALPNPWDVGSARLIQHLGFQAVASTSGGYAWSTGRPDYGVD